MAPNTAQNFAPPGFGIKAKLSAPPPRARLFCPPRFWNQGKARHDGACGKLYILPPPVLESRQSSIIFTVVRVDILPPPVLESRQSRQASMQIVAFHFAPPGFGIKAKLPVCTAAPLSYFAPPGFGIKAKPSPTPTLAWRHFAPPGFGIKAKQRYTCPPGPVILPPPVLESRQSRAW